MAEKNKQVAEADKFSGKANGLTWEKSDEKVVSWGRLKFGEKYARALWRDELLPLRDLVLTYRRSGQVQIRRALRSRQ